MEILYCYIEKYRNIKYQQFNLNSKLRFYFDKVSNEFYIKANNDYLDNFFSDNNEMDLIALIGKNGTGKTTIINLLHHVFFTGFVIQNSKEQYLNYNNIFAVKRGDIVNIYISQQTFSRLRLYINNRELTRFSRTIELNNKVAIEFIVYDIETKVNIINEKNRIIIGPVLSKEDSTLIYYSNQYDFNWRKVTTNADLDFKDISLNNRLYQDIALNNKFFNYDSHIQNPDNRFLISSSQRFLNDDIRSKIRYLEDEKNRIYIERFLQIPQYLYISLDYMNSKNEIMFLDVEKEKLLRYERNNTENFNIENSIYIGIEKENWGFRENFLKRVIDSYFTDIEKFLFFDSLVQSFKKYEQKNYENRLNKEIYEYLQIFKQLFKDFAVQNDKIGDIEISEFEDRFIKITNTYQNFFVYLVKDFFAQGKVQFESTFINKNKENKEGVISLSLEEEHVLKIETCMENMIFINEFINEYKKLDTSTQFLVLDWGALSTGEDNLFTFIVQIEKSLKECMKSSILLLIDEGDLTLHPEWQRNYINILTEIINSEVSDKQVQVILTTHSPLIISDLPIWNITMLERNKNVVGIEVESRGIENTFAANIHNLYKNGQFLESTTGEFAIKKVQNILDFLNSKEDKNIKEFRELYDKTLKLIRIIGDPIVQTQLLNLLEKKKNSYVKQGKNKTLDYLRQIQESIKNEINVLENQNDFN